MPFYDNAYTRSHQFETRYSGVAFMGRNFNFRVLELKDEQLGFDLFLIDIPELLFTDFVYSENDTERFLAFQIAALNWIVQHKDAPSVVHCHDHHTGLVPFMMSHSEAYQSLKSTPSILTIHNAQYQGWFSHDKLHLIPKFPLSKIGLLEWDHSINPLAAAIKCAWRVTTVSPSYMEELKVRANGLEGLLAHESAKCVGILNGIDWKVWNPETDEYLVKNYTNTSVLSGKKANKAFLCERFDLDPKRPLFSFIGRLVGEKGADLFPEIFHNALMSAEISVLLLGSGHDEVEQRLNDLKKLHPGTFNAYIGYSEELSHIMYAGSDFLLMPSRVEPCGLNQMYSLRYGTVPIVSSVGGLKDTVIDIGNDGFGIRHDHVTVGEVVYAIQRGKQFFDNEKEFKKIRKRIMKIDHSWNGSAKEYIQLYKSLIP
ncbi:MAG: glycogen/starch synthase, partial [Bacteroidota bacterium]